MGMTLITYIPQSPTGSQLTVSESICCYRSDVYIQAMCDYSRRPLFALWLDPEGWTYYQIVRILGERHEALHNEFP